MSILLNRVAKGFDRHLKIHEVAAMFPKEWAEFFKFAVVRNPYDRVVSCWRYDMENTERYRDNQLGLEAYMVDNLDKRWLWTQQLWTHLNGKLAINRVLRFETLGRDFKNVCDRLKIDKKALPHKHKTKHGPYQKYYTDSTRAVLELRCAADLKEWGYTFE